MRLQRYQEGANAWVLFIWSRHPRWSLTWTHGIELVKHRSKSGQRRWGFFRLPGYQARYGVTVAGYTLQLVTQRALRKETPHD